MITLWSEPSEDVPRMWFTASLVVRILVSAFFLFMAAKSLAGDEGMVADWQRWGYSDGFRRSIAGAQIVGAALLLWPATIFLGGALLVGVLLGALATHIVNDPPATLLSPLIFLLLVWASILPHRPPSLR